MAFYDNWGKRIQQTGKEAVDWTKKNAEVVRLNGTVTGLEKDITSQYTEIGKIYYQKHAGDEQDPDLVLHFQTISDNLKTIEDCKKQINELKGYRECVNCGKAIIDTAAFCNYCGARQVPEYTASTPDRKCPNCGAALEEDQVFCTECGARVKDSEPEPAPEPTPGPTSDFVSEPEPETGVETEAEEETALFCVNCGAPLADDDLFCTNCGQKVEG